MAITLDGTTGITASGNITGNYILGNGSQLSGIITSVSSLSNGTSNVAVTSSGGNVTVGVGGTPNVAVFTATGANISGTFNVTGNTALANVLIATSKSIDVGNNRIMNVAEPVANTDAVTKSYVDSITSSGFTVQDDTANTTVVSAGDTLVLSGTANEVTVSITAADTVTFGLPDSVSVTGNITANYFLGNGSQLTGIDATAIQNGTSNVRVAASGNVTVSSAGTANVLTVTSTGANVTGTLNATGNANVGNLGATTVVATTLTGTLSTAAQPNITSTGTLTSLSVTGNITGGNLLINTDAVITGNLTVQGNTTTINSNVITTNDLNITVGNNQNTGAALNNAGIDVGNNNLATWRFNNATTSWQSNIAIMPTANGTLTLGGTSNYWGAAYVTSITATGNANVGNIGATAVVATNLTGTLQTAAQTNITSVGTLGSLSVTGNITGGNLLTGGNIFDTGALSIITAASGNINLAPNGTNMLVATTTGANIAGTLNATGNVTGSYFFGNGSQLTGIDATAIQNGTANVRAFLNGNVTVSAAGTANVLVVTSTGANIAGTLNTGTGNANVGNIGATAVVATNLTGTLQTAAQTNITSVGTLGSLSVTGNVSTGNVSGTTGTFTNVAGTLSTAAQTNITSVGTLGSLTVTGNIGGGNVNAILNGSGANVTSISATNISSGTLAQARLANAAVTLGSTALTLGSTVTTVAGLTSVTSTTFVGALTGAATTAGTVTTAAQANITSVGTLTALTVSGAITVNSGAAATAIVNGATTGVGNIGSSTVGFNTIFAKATSAQYADLAEMYEADQIIEPGTVVCFGGNKEITVCSSNASSRVAGVISTNPSYIMNSGLQGEYVVPVTLQGRVPVRVTGIIAKGDMMVATADGRARAEKKPKIGTVIGKALADFDGTDGVIEVVVGRL